MSPGYWLYNMILSLAAPLALGATAARGRLRGNWRERLGFITPWPPGRHDRIWIHAASVGEAQVASALADALLKAGPLVEVFLTTTTDTGRESARNLLPDGFPIRTFPIDAYGSPGRALARLNPDLVILLETELWPNFVRAARAHGSRLMLANGRISPRSLKNYRRFRFLFRDVLGYLDLMAMIRPSDRERIISLGADPSRVKVAGNAKYDLLLDRVDADRTARLRRKIGLEENRPVFVAGSTRPGEERLILDVFQRLQADFPLLHLVIAPRHVGRAGELEALIRGRGLTALRRSMPGNTPADAGAEVTLVDVMGELFYWYGLATMAFCGASLVPLGGQNPLEPAAWAVPVLYGPSMEDFLDATEILEPVGAGRAVAGPDELYLQAMRLLTDSAEARQRGQAGRAALENQRGASGYLAELALNLLAMDKSKLN